MSVVNNTADTAPQTRPVKVKKAGRVNASERPVNENRVMTWVWNILAIVFAVVMAFPIYWMVLTTVQPGKDLLSENPKFWPSAFDFSSYHTVFADPNFLPDLKNTVLITLGAVLLGLIVGFLAAVGVARFRFRGRNPFIIAILIVQMVPLLALIIPLYLILNSAGLYNELFGVILAYLVFTIPYVIWTLRSFIVNIPVELDEAAMVDGCTRWGANTLLSSTNKQTSMVWLTFYSNTPTRAADYGAQMAGSLLISLPVIVLFVIFQKRLGAGLTAGAVKG
jgi:N,N'-diacetylchitobiose transport system permease protein